MQRKAMKTQLLGPGICSFFVSKGLPSRQQDDLLDGVKGSFVVRPFTGCHYRLSERS